MSKRYVKEFINDWIASYQGTTAVIAAAAIEYGNKVLRYYTRGLITSFEAVKMVSSTDAWELAHGCGDRFNGGI